jgi:hypothetical protein
MSIKIIHRTAALAAIRDAVVLRIGRTGDPHYLSPGLARELASSLMHYAAVAETLPTLPAGGTPAYRPGIDLIQ